MKVGRDSSCDLMIHDWQYRRGSTTSLDFTSSVPDEKNRDKCDVAKFTSLYENISILWSAVIFSRLRRRGARGLEWQGRTVPEGVVVEQGVGLEGHSIVSNVLG